MKSAKNRWSGQVILLGLNLLTGSQKALAALTDHKNCPSEGFRGGIFGAQIEGLSNSSMDLAGFQLKVNRNLAKTGPRLGGSRIPKFTVKTQSLLEKTHTKNVKNRQFWRFGAINPYFSELIQGSALIKHD